MNKKVLPLENNTWIQTYHIRNYELGLLQDKTPWIFSKYINCYYDAKARGKFNHCTPEGRYFAKSKVFLIQKFRFDKSILSFDIIDFIQWAKDLINHGWYIMGYYDEYYIPSKSAYNKYHFRHTLLIYGYDDQHQMFEAIGYTKDRKYKSHPISYEEFLSAIKIEFDRNKEEFVKENIDKLEFEAFKLNPEYKFDFNLKEIYQSIKDYINSEENGCRNQKGLKYGINCEKEFINYIRNHKEGPIDERYSRFFMELKELMVRRLNYLYAEGIISDAILEKYKKICDKQKTIHALFIKYNITHNRELIVNMAEKMAGIIEDELKLLPEINDQIYSCLVKRFNEGYC